MVVAGDGGATVRRYRSDGERNLWHNAAEGWRDNGRHYLDEPRFLGPRRWPLPITVVMVAAAAAATLGLWLWITG